MNASNNGASCNDYSEANFIAGLRDETSQDRSWWWQKCSEFGYFKPSYGPKRVFFSDVALEPIVDWCSAMFGIADLKPATDAINKKYGGKSPKGTNIISTNGIFDPWHLLSVTKSDDAKNIKAVLYEAGHWSVVFASLSRCDVLCTVCVSHACLRLQCADDCSSRQRSAVAHRCSR